MKSLWKIALAAAAFALGFASTGVAQIMRVSVPFDFQAGEQSLAAGTYEVRMDAATRVVKLITVDGAAGCYLPVRTSSVANETGKPSLVFHNYGKAYFLATVKTPAAGQAYELFGSRAEREAATQSAGRRTTVVLYASR